MTDLAAIEAAARTIAGAVVRTPCLESRTLSAITGARIFLKFENLQYTASFKERGALTRLAALTASERARGVLAVSAGNHAQGVAHHAARLGIRAVIVMPRFTPSVKAENTRALGAEVVLHGDGFDAAREHGTRLAAERDLVIVPPYDDDAVIAGQGTVALEMLADAPSIDTLVVPAGGGGLLAGMAIVAKSRPRPIEIVGVQSCAFPALRAAWRGETPVFAGATIADGIAVRRPGVRTLAIARRCVDDIVAVDDGVIERAVLMLLEVEKTVVEGAGAVPLAALLAEPGRWSGRTVGLVLSGGNIDPLLLADIIERGMVRSGRLTRLRVTVRDLPGSLAAVTAILAEQNANIEEVHHQRAFTDAPALAAEVDFVLKTRNAAHVAAIVAALAGAGFPAELAND